MVLTFAFCASPVYSIFSPIYIFIRILPRLVCLFILFFFFFVVPIIFDVLKKKIGSLGTAVIPTRTSDFGFPQDSFLFLLVSSPFCLW